MKTTIDRAGRVVIPKTLRNSLHYTPGTILEIIQAGNELRLRPHAEEPAFIQKHGVLVHHGESPEDIQIADFIQQQRENRGLDKGLPRAGS